MEWKGTSIEAWKRTSRIEMRAGSGDKLDDISRGGFKPQLTSLTCGACKSLRGSYQRFNVLLVDP